MLGAFYYQQLAIAHIPLVFYEQYLPYKFTINIFF